jgi:hypothetical protein
MQLAQMAHPVSVCHQWSMTGTPKIGLSPLEGVGIGALAGQEKGLEVGQVVFLDQFCTGDPAA